MVRKDQQIISICDLYPAAFVKSGLLVKNNRVNVTILEGDKYKHPISGVMTKIPGNMRRICISGKRRNIDALIKNYATWLVEAKQTLPDTPDHNETQA